jgi:hypothetical protein
MLPGDSEPPTAAPCSARPGLIADYRRLPIAERGLASRGRFTASEAVHGRAVLVIDDVVTSGAQAGDAIRALAEAGASALGFVAIARASAGPGGPVTRPRIAIRRLAKCRDRLAARLPYDQADG